ncbi:hypothetical protein D1T48_gp01 [Thermoproteus tenax virus 1]|uniref:Uncharacterized 7.9 kDa protein n=1 Tax=Thermoproteus tenax virus 1 (strain KRA1) TaxID=10480 RepID=YOR1_TTV1K|nr:hypothetical protein D1T48_gp01 [Thermoproteus tenax virus 1]P19276.1 RecName: Full=Uncharacterized 7.9 kDa protein [Thermoproteus tenax virus 1 (STRAIN KRA1)]CAA32969.1 unnamed protein product [Thermoproteus tenax virus 1]
MVDFPDIEVESIPEEIMEEVGEYIDIFIQLTEIAEMERDVIVEEQLKDEAKQFEEYEDFWFDVYT